MAAAGLAVGFSVVGPIIRDLAGMALVWSLGRQDCLQELDQEDW